MKFFWKNSFFRILKLEGFCPNYLSINGKRKRKSPPKMPWLQQPAQSVGLSVSLACSSCVVHFSHSQPEPTWNLHAWTLLFVLLQEKLISETLTMGSLHGRSGRAGALCLHCQLWFSKLLRTWKLWRKILMPPWVLVVMVADFRYYIQSKNSPFLFLLILVFD